MRRAGAGFVVAVLAAVAVGTTTMQAVGAAVPTDLTGTEVCDLLGTAEVGTALGVTVASSSPSTSGTPQCSYTYRDAAGTTTNVVVAVQRAEGDLGGRTGKKAHKYAVKLNKTYAGKGSKFSNVKGVGVAATFADGKATKNLILATKDGRVVTVAGSGLTKASASALGKAVAAQLA